MAGEPGSHRANILVDLSVESFQDTVRAAVNDQVDVIMADLEANYHSRVLHNSQVHGLQVSVNIDYNIRSLDSEADLSDEIARLNLDNAGTDDRSDQPDIEDLPDEEADPTILASVAMLLDSLPVINLDDLQEDSKNCPVCQEAFPGSDLGEVDTPVMLHCSHIIGRACIERWISGDHNSCPLCRAAIFEPALLTTPTNEEEEEEDDSEPTPEQPLRAPQIAHGSQEEYAELILFARECAVRNARRQLYGAHTAIEENEAALVEPERLPALATEGEWETEGSAPQATDEIELEFLALERESVEQRARLTRLLAGPRSEERMVAINMLIWESTDLNTRLTNFRMGILGFEG